MILLSLSGPCRAPDYLKLYFYLLICRLSLQASESRCACPVPCCALPAGGHDGGRANIVHSLPGPHSPSHWWGHTVTSSKPAAPFPGVRGRSSWLPGGRGAHFCPGLGSFWYSPTAFQWLSSGSSSPPSLLHSTQPPVQSSTWGSISGLELGRLQTQRLSCSCQPAPPHSDSSFPVNQAEGLESVSTFVFLTPHPVPWEA